MTGAPWILLAMGALALLLSRPYLESRWPPGALALALGGVLGQLSGGPAPDARIGIIEILLGVAGGWLALAAAEPFSLRDAGRSSLPGRPALLLVAGLLAGGAAFLLSSPPAERPAWSVLIALAAPYACLVMASDPESARARLSRAVRPGALERDAPRGASLALGLALAWAAMTSRPLVALVTGLALGLAGALLIRLSEGKGTLLACLATISLLAGGLAGVLGVSTPAVAFIAGAVVAQDSRRRDLVFTLLEEMRRPITLALLIGCGAALQPMLSAGAPPWERCAVAAGVLIGARLAFQAAARLARLGPASALAMSPLALLIGLESIAPGRPAPGAALPIAAAGAFVVFEAAWMAGARGRGRG